MSRKSRVERSGGPAIRDSEFLGWDSMGREVSPLRLMVVGFVLLAASWLVALLMVIGQIPKDLLISLGAYAASVLGFGLGMVGAILYVRRGAV